MFPPSRAGSLPHSIAFLWWDSVKLWERACSRRRFQRLRYIRVVSRYTGNPDTTINNAA